MQRQRAETAALTAGIAGAEKVPSTKRQTALLAHDKSEQGCDDFSA